MKIITFSSIKGGTGKSSLAILTGNLLAKSGYRVLMIDTDIQNSLSFYYLDELGLADEKNLAIAFFLKDLEKNVVDSNYDERLKIVPASFGLIEFRTAHPKTLRRLLPQIENRFDYCIVDSPPTYNNLVLNGMVAADLIISPCKLSQFDYKGLAFFRAKVQEEAEAADRWRILINFFRSPRSESEDNLTNQYLNLFKTTFNNILDFQIPETVYIPRAIDTREVISQARAKERVFDAFYRLADYVADRELVPEGRF